MARDHQGSQSALFHYQRRLYLAYAVSLHSTQVFLNLTFIFFSLFRYMKYLYPYECEKEKLSSPEELQMAIDGNRREGRRSSYGQYPEISSSPPPASMLGGSAGRGLSNQNLFGVTNGLHGVSGGVGAALSLVSGRSQNHLNSHHHLNNHHHSLLHSQMLNGHHSNSQGHSSGTQNEIFYVHVC